MRYIKTLFLGYVDPGSGFTLVTLSSGLIAFLLGSFGILLLLFKKRLKFLRRQKNKALIIILILITAGVIMGRKEVGFDKKLIVLGFDGLSPEIIEPMMEENLLPNFSRLKQQGSYKHLSTTNPSQSPVAWAAFATGQNPGKNGIFDFISRDPKTYRLRLSVSDIEKGKPKRTIKSECFWQYMARKNIPTTIITCPVSFPADKLCGRMLSGMGVPDILGTEGTFTFYTTEGLDKNKDTGGKVFQIKKHPSMIMYLIGPRVASFGGKTENVKVPFKATLSKGKGMIVIEYQSKKNELKAGQWSDWQEVTFKLGWFKKVRGIFKFYLVQTEPEFKLYISAINFDPRKPLFPISYPKNYSKELALADSIGLYHTQGMPMDTWAVNAQRLTEQSFLEQVNEILREKTRMLEFELKRFKNGLLFCYFASPDIIQHMFWRYTDPGHPLYEKDAPQEYKQAITNWYKKMDDILGYVMKSLNKEDTLVVLSDHGFNTFRRAVHINSWLRKNGYLELKNPDAESGAELLQDINWLRTRAYSIGFGAIYLNQEGREKKGIVKAGKDTEPLKEEISRKLKEWRDEKYNIRIINNVYKRGDIFWGNYIKDAPDLYIGFNIGYRASWQTALGAVPKGLIEDNLKKWSGDHLFDPALIPGVIFSNKKISKENPSIYDISPTILSIAGYSAREIKSFEMDGDLLF